VSSELRREAPGGTCYGVEALEGAAHGLGAVLAEIDDPDSELTAHPATRARLQGAAMALQAVQVSSSMTRSTNLGSSADRISLADHGSNS
jgi:hypothetical protein